MNTAVGEAPLQLLAPRAGGKLAWFVAFFVETLQQRSWLRYFRKERSSLAFLVVQQRHLCSPAVRLMLNKLTKRTTPVYFLQYDLTIGNVLQGIKLTLADAG